MKKYFRVAISILIFTGTGCQKMIVQKTDQPLNQQPSPPLGKSILVDASKDGGTWWYPQSTFDATIDHQGKRLADYLRSLGYLVDELPRGAVITKELLDKYSRVLRSPAFFQYSDDEISAYDHFLTKPGAIMLLQDHLSYASNDALSEHLGIQFRGAVDGTVTNFISDSITQDVSSLMYIAGAVVVNTANNPNIFVQGSISNYTVLNNSDPFAGATNTDAPVMGILKTYPNTKIFFLGDENGIELVPQPFTQNLVRWLFE